MAGQYGDFNELLLQEMEILNAPEEAQAASVMEPRGNSERYYL